MRPAERPSNLVTQDELGLMILRGWTVVENTGSPVHPGYRLLRLRNDRIHSETFRHVTAATSTTAHEQLNLL